MSIRTVITCIPGISRLSVVILAFICAGLSVVDAQNSVMNNIIPRPTSIYFTSGACSLSFAENPDAFCVRILPSGAPSGAYSLRVTTDSVMK